MSALIEVLIWCQIGEKSSAEAMMIQGPPQYKDVVLPV